MTLPIGRYDVYYRDKKSYDPDVPESYLERMPQGQLAEVDYAICQSWDKSRYKPTRIVVGVGPSKQAGPWKWGRA